MSQRNNLTIASGVKLLIFTLVSIVVTGTLAAIMGNIGFGSGTTYQAVFTSATSLEKGDDVRVAGVNVGEVKSVDHYERNNAIVTFRVKSDVPLTTASQRRDPVPQPGGRPLHGARGGRRHRSPRPSTPATSSRSTHTEPGPRPHRAVQRVQAAVPGAATRPGQRADDEPRAGAPGRGRDHSGPAGAHGVADQHPGRPRPADRGGRQQPRHHARDGRQPARAAGEAGRRAQGLDGRPGPRPPDHRLVAGQHLRPDRGAGRPAPPGSAAAQGRHRPAPPARRRC